jgi:hypothetical protein
MRKIPDNNQSATEASRQVGEAELTPRPMAAPNANKIDDTAAAVSAPSTIGDQAKCQAGSTLRSSETGSMVVIRPSPQAEERKNSHNDHDQSNQVNDAVHRAPPILRSAVEPGASWRVPNGWGFIALESLSG